MKEYWDSLDAGDRRMLMIGGGVMLVLIMYLYAWKPLQENIASLESENASNKALVAWMQPTVKKIRQLNQNNPGRGNTGGQSILSLVDRTSKAVGLTKQVSRIQPRSEDSVQISLEQAPFNTVINWLFSLRKQYGIEVESIKMDRQEAGGLVNAQLVVSSS